MNLNSYIKLTFSLLLLPISFSLVAQEDSTKLSDVEEVVVVGSQIKGAKITGALPVSIFSGKDIEALGVDGGDELLENFSLNKKPFKISNGYT